MEKRDCKQCGDNFEIADWDLEFLKKVSPTFDGRAFEIPMPTLCPDCRRQRRTVWRNNQTLYSRDCDLCGKQIVSMYSPDKPYKVYCQDCWWSDKWDPCNYGQNFDPSKPFFEQFEELLLKVPRIALMNTNSENSEFCNYAGNNKNCYLAVAGSWNDENCLYVYHSNKSRECLDSQFADECELCYEVVRGSSLYKCAFCRICIDSSECYFSNNLKGCDHCIFCSNLRNKSYYAHDKPCSKEDFEKLVTGLGSYQKIQSLKEKFMDIQKQAIYPNVEQYNCEDCTGDELYNCKNVKESYDSFNLENSKYVMQGGDAKDILDSTAAGLDGTELTYETISTGAGAYNCHFASTNWTSRDTFYCESISNSNNCFGSISLKHKEYCILNKQYSKEEYEKKVAEIIESMKKAGEWGQFFPVSLSPFGYNETMANEYFPISKEQAKKIGARWQENDYSPNYSGDYYEPKDNIGDYIDSEVEVKKALASVIKCEMTGKPFKIMPHEMAFYLNNKIALPRKHYNVRFAERFNTINPRKLYHRQCMCEESEHVHQGRCQNVFDTTFAPDRPEKIYCESCYQKSVL